MNPPSNFTFDLLESFDAIHEKIAIIDDNRSITYQELRHEILIAAINLWQQGLRPGDRYIIMMPDSIKWQAAFLGGIYIGAVPVVLAPNASAEQRKYTITTSQATVILCKEDNNIDLSDTNCIKFTNILTQSSAPIPEVHLFGSQDPAMWLSCSGTGGHIPKWVVHPHKTFYTATDVPHTAYGTNSNDTVFNTSKMSFSYGLIMVLQGLRKLATIVLTSEIPSARLVCDLVSTHKVTQLFSVPTVMLNLSKLATRPDALDSANIIVTSGEVLSEVIEDKIYNLYGKKIYNLYGTTETLFITLNNTHHHKFKTIGKTPPTVQNKIVDNELQEVPHGTIGELLTYSPSRGLYYSNDHEATSRAFMDNGWFKTGDLCYIDNDGMYCYVGRKNDCFKVNGIFVTPMEIENSILKYPEIVDCMVSSVRRNDGKLIIVANVVKENISDQTSAKKIKEFLITQLESHKIPNIINFVAEIPKTITMKKIRSKIQC